MNINAGHEITSKARIIHQIQLIRGITNNFKTDIYFVSTFEPSTKSVDLLTVETFAGTVCKQTDSEMPKEWTINRGLYASFRWLC